MAKELLRGYEMIARGLKNAGVERIFTYPGTPATKVAEAAQKLGIDVEYSVNEIVAFGGAIGYSLAGGFPAVVQKHLGQHVAQDAAVAAAYAEVPMLVVVGTDPEPSSSQNSADPRWLFFHAKIPFIEVFDGKSTAEGVKLAAKLALEYSTPLGIVFTKRFSYGVDEFADNKSLELKNEERIKDVRNYQLPFISKVQKERVEKKLKRLSEVFEGTELNFEIKGKGREGSYIIEATLSPEFYSIKNKYEEVLALSTFPVPEEKIEKFLKRRFRRSKKLHVVEENGEFYSYLVSRTLARNKIQNKVIYDPIASFYGIKKKEKAFKDRQANLCPGCPHHYTYLLLKEVAEKFPGEIYFVGDRGCYNRGGLSPYNLLDVVMYMGGSIQIAHGISKKDPNKRVVAVIGDSTFHHAGYNALKNAVAYGSKFVLAVLDNGITAMTGHQPNPSTPREGGKPTIRIERELKALGIEYEILNPFLTKEKNIKTIQKAFNYVFKEKTGIYALIFRAPCVLYLQRLGKTGKPVIKDYRNYFLKNSPQ